MQPVEFQCSVDVRKAYEEQGRWIVEGLAATSDIDLQEDIISQQAIEASAQDLLENSTVLHNHNTNESIGKVEKSEAREGGLWLKIFVSQTVPDIWQKITEGVLNKFSIRGRILEARKQWIESLGKYARIIFKMKLLEVSLVAVPANPKARAIRWYVEKALEEYEAGGGCLEEMEKEEQPDRATKEGGTAMTQTMEVIEEELIEASGDSVETAKAASKPESSPPKDMAGRVRFLLDKLLAGEQSKNRKAMLDEIKELMSQPAAQSKEALEKSKSLAEEDVEKAGRKISNLRLAKLKKLLEELNQIIAEADTAPDAQKQGPKEHDPELITKLSELEGAVSAITKSLGLGAGEDKEAGEATLMNVIKEISKRLEALENIPAVRTSLDGQEQLVDDRKGKNVWKGLI